MLQSINSKDRIKIQRLLPVSIRIIPSVFVLTVLLFLTACAVGPDYVRPTVPVPESYKENAGWKVAEPSDYIDRGRWWEIYNDPQLNALEEQVDISNQNIAAAEAVLHQALAQVRMDQSFFFPTITTNPSATRSLRSSSLTSGSTPSGTSTIYSAPLTLSSWELDVWGRIRRTVEGDRANAQASDADLKGARLSAQTSLAQNYFTLRTLDRMKQLLDTTVAAYEKALQLTKNQYESGIVSRGDVLQAETQLKSIRAQAIDLGVQRAQTEHAIAVLVGKPASEFSIPVSPLDTVPPLVPTGVPSELLERRPDIAGMERRMAAANAQIGVAKAAYFPAVTLNGAMGYQSNGMSNWLTWPNRYWALGTMVSQALFDGGFRFAQSDKARAAYDQSIAAYRQMVLTAFQEVEDNLASLRMLEEMASVQDDAVKTARKSVEIALNQYKGGTANYLAVVVLQSAALSAERTAATIMNNRMTASVLLIKALGGGWNVEPFLGVDNGSAKRVQQEPEPVEAPPTEKTTSSNDG
ncbi:MAG: efflux transporter outer membrane subunit [Syntrophobacterales bacterium]|jgi:NodT family efflux transporter outer membrane factor (OMF) lipoprotein|nr:efflux transporter outer membrane subunit [Syntrophobacterales bacterium]